MVCTYVRHVLGTNYYDSGCKECLEQGRILWHDVLAYSQQVLTFKFAHSPLFSFTCRRFRLLAAALVFLPSLPGTPIHSVHSPSLSFACRHSRLLAITLICSPSLWFEWFSPGWPGFRTYSSGRSHSIIPELVFSTYYFYPLRINVVIWGQIANSEDMCRYHQIFGIICGNMWSAQMRWTYSEPGTRDYEHVSRDMRYTMTFICSDMWCCPTILKI